MNSLTFNSVFVPVLKIMGIEESSLQCPLIEWENNSNTISQDDKSLIFGEDKTVRFPFESFRVFGRGDGSCKESFKMVIMSDKSTPKDFQYIPIHRDNYAQSILVLYAINRSKIVLGSLIGATKDGRACSRPWSFDGKAIKIIPHESAFREECSAGLIFYLLRIAADFMNPHVFLCKKSPQIPHGKSVLWQRAREHYVFLHKSHPSNKIGATGGEAEKGGATVERMAHSRRAHFRLLRSAKYKKIGQRIWIKSAWVGPKEWKDRSGQIYKIIDK